MRTSVCIFFDEEDAKEMIGYLRRRHLGVTLVRRTAALDNGDEFPLNILAAERPEHPLILDRIAEMDSMHRSLLRCAACRSARLSIGLDDNPSPTLRLIRSLLEKLAPGPSEVTQTIVCRDCNGTVGLPDIHAPQATADEAAIAAVAA